MQYSLCYWLSRRAEERTVSLVSRHKILFMGISSSVNIHCEFDTDSGRITGIAQKITISNVTSHG